MEGLLEFLYLILIIGALFIILVGWRAVSVSIQKIKYSNIISCLNTQGYRFYGRYNSKGKGLLYRKTIQKEIIDSLLLRYKFDPIELNGEFDIIDYVAILRFPEWEERIPGIAVYEHGGLRLFHFYAIAMSKGEKVFQRPLNYYLDNDMGGEVIAPIGLKNQDIIQAILSSGIKDAISQFNNDELRYWKKENNS